MTHADTPDAAAEPDRHRRHFALRRLHSLCGVLPIGVFLVVHLWTNLHAIRGRDAFRHAVGEIQTIPALPLIELVAIIAPPPGGGGATTGGGGGGCGASAGVLLSLFALPLLGWRRRGRRQSPPTRC